MFLEAKPRIGTPQCSAVTWHTGVFMTEVPHLWSPSPVVWTSKTVRQFPGISVSEAEKKLRKRDLRSSKQSPGKGSPGSPVFVLPSRMAALPRCQIDAISGNSRPCTACKEETTDGKHQVLGAAGRGLAWISWEVPPVRSVCDSPWSLGWKPQLASFLDTVFLPESANSS